jgi:Na+:H+ antiporter, NhaA family
MIKSSFANAGLPLSVSDFSGSIAVTIFAGFVLGKPIGIMMFSWLAVRLHVAILPMELSWSVLAGGSMLAGIGFTMALLIADMAFDETLIESAKLGIFLASLFSATAGIAFLMWLPANGKRL